MGRFSTARVIRRRSSRRPPPRLLQADGEIETVYSLKQSS
jgi:hypothetical protein